MIRSDRLGSVLSAVGALLLVVVAYRFPANYVAASIGTAMILVGVMIQVVSRQ